MRSLIAATGITILRLGWHPIGSALVPLVDLLFLVLASSSEGRMMLSKRRAGGLCRCVWLLSLPLFAACTWTADGFSPELLAGAPDAGVLLVPDVTTAPSASATD